MSCEKTSEDDVMQHMSSSIQPKDQSPEHFFELGNCVWQQTEGVPTHSDNELRAHMRATEEDDDIECGVYMPIAAYSGGR
jgi:hypothetical protein